MANRNFIVQNGLQVGPLVIDAATGSITTTGTVSVGGLSVSEISKNDSKISINDTGSSSNIQMTIDGTVEHTVSTNGVSLASGSWYAINGTSVLSATALGTGVTSSGLTSVGTLTGLTVSGTAQLTSVANNNGVQYNSGALQVAGGTGIGGNLYVGGNLFVAGNTTVVNTSISNSVTGNLVVGPGLSFTAINANIQYSGNQNSYLQMQMQNRNAGNNSSTDYVATANNGTDTDTYIDLGINGSGYVPSSPFSASYPNDGYLYVQGNTTTNGGNLMLATMTNKNIFFATNGTASSPYIDFNTSTSAVDYNVRIQASGPATGVGAGVLSITANGGVSVQGTITPSANVTYDLGSSSKWFNKFYGVAMQSQYADLAENYQADKLYSTGFVLMFGGAEEVTLADANTTRVAGVVSTNPAHLMNGGLVGPNVVPLALTGRVPCRIIGPVKKGDMMISAGWGYAKATDSPQLGQVIGKALEDFPMTEKGIIEIVVGRL